MFYIIYQNFLTKDSQKLNIGGIETYLLNLCEIIIDIGQKVSIIQTSNFDFHTVYNCIDVYGYKYENSKAQKIGKYLLSKLKLEKKDVIIFGSEEYSQKCDNKVITIQHGIYWDKPSCRNTFLKYFIHYLKCYRTKKWVENSNQLVCVDYNFPNWYRATFGTPKFKFITIPNFAVEQEVILKKQETVKIIFARRFYEYRGTKVFAESINSLLKTRNNVFITIAGDGPDKPYLQCNFKNNKNVKFITYNSSESYTIHKDMDIAVVPTTGSEGTSLSLLEAMASGCACICSDIGGLTNIILNNFNGIIVPAGDSDALYQAIVKLVDDYELRRSLSSEAINTISKSFSHSAWTQNWKKVLIENLK